MALMQLIADNTEYRKIFYDAVIRHLRYLQLPADIIESQYDANVNKTSLIVLSINCMRNTYGLADIMLFSEILKDCHDIKDLQGDWICEGILNVITANSLTYKPPAYYGQLTNYEYGIVQRLIDVDKNLALFYEDCIEPLVAWLTLCYAKKTLIICLDDSIDYWLDAFENTDLIVGTKICNEPLKPNVYVMSESQPIFGTYDQIIIDDYDCLSIDRLPKTSKYILASRNIESIYLMEYDDGWVQEMPCKNITLKQLRKSISHDKSIIRCIKND